MRQRGDRFPEQIELLGNCVLSDEGRSRHVSARSSEADHEPDTNCVSNSSKDDWNCRGSFLRCKCRWRSPRREDEVDPESGQLGRESRETVGMSVGPPELEIDVLTFNPAEFAQHFIEAIEDWRRSDGR